MEEIGLIHVVYAPFGLPPLRAFLDSYRQHPAGVDHALIFVCKGFDRAELPADYGALLTGVKHRALFVPDGGFDLGSYLFAACAIEHRFVCCLNSSSVILADGWLASLRTALANPNVGIVGATGSHESHATNLRCHLGPSGRGPRRLIRFLRSRLLLLRMEREYSVFPNPHVRTNAFLIERQRLLAVPAGPFLTKEDCHRFEGGRKGLTAAIRRAGLQPRVVDRNGCAWPPEQWRESCTFRAGMQENLLVSDNRTRDYQAADEVGRHLLAQTAWGS